jgi:hypothetical protein
MRWIFFFFIFEIIRGQKQGLWSRWAVILNRSGLFLMGVAVVIDPIFQEYYNLPVIVCI